MWVMNDSPLDLTSIPIGEYAFPGPLRDALVSAILSGEKTRSGEPLPSPTGGELEAVIDSKGKIVCVTRTTRNYVTTLAQVSDEHARKEGEGYANAHEWRVGHERFWTSDELVTALGDPPFTLTDDTQVLCSEFEVIEKYV